MPRLTCLALVVVSVAWTSSAVAQGVSVGAPAGQRAAGEALLQAGKVAYDAGDYPTAVRNFEQALTRLDRPTIHYDIGQAAARAGDHPRALAAFREYLSALPNAANRAEVERRIRVHGRAIANPGTPLADLSPSAARLADPSSPEPSAPMSENEVDPQADASVDPGGLAISAQARDGGELWWLWAGIGAAVVGTVVAALVVTTGDDPVQPPMRGDVGGTIQTLEAR